MKRLSKTKLFTGILLCLSAFQLLSFSAFSQVPTFGSAAVLSNSVTSGIVNSNVQWVQMRPSAITVTFTNGGNSATLNLYNLVSFDAVNFFTNGFVSITPPASNNGFALSSTNTWTISTNFYAYGTNMPVFVKQVADLTPHATTNVASGSGTYGP